MIQEIQSLINQYLNWLKDKTTLRQLENWVEITTPYLDRHNDYLQIYVKHDNSGYLLTDDGYIIRDLQISGCMLDTAKRKSLLTLTLNGFGVKLNEDHLEVNATKENFARQKHSLIQAMLAVNDLFYLATPIVISLFYEDVMAWFDQHEIRYTQKWSYTGKTGFTHVFDFIIPKSAKRPERIVQTINRPGRDTVQRLAFSWIDTKDMRPQNSEAYALLNDSEKSISDSDIEALKSYEITPIPWKSREDYRQGLAA